MRTRFQPILRWTLLTAAICVLHPASAKAAPLEPSSTSESAPVKESTATADEAPTAGRTALIAGSITFGVGYLPALAIGVESLRYGYAPGAFMFIPVAGPFVSALWEGPKNAHPLLLAALLLDGVIQTTGATIAFLGWRQRRAALTDASAGTPEPSNGVAWIIGGGPGTSLGLSLTIIHP